MAKKIKDLNTKDEFTYEDKEILNTENMRKIECPEWLDTDEAYFFEELVGELEKLGMHSYLDSGLLAIYVKEYKNLEWLYEAQSKCPLNTKQYKELSNEIDKSVKRMISASKETGLALNSRYKLLVNKENKATSNSLNDLFDV